MNNTDLEHYLEILQTFSTAMLVTIRDGELRSRPMAVADRSSDGRIRFLTSIESGKLEELTEAPHVNIALQAASRFMSVSGTTMTSRDPDTVAELWSPAFGAWFQDGPDDPDVIVLEVIPTYAEYWDNSGVEGIRTLFELGKSAVTGDVPQFDDSVHQKVEFDDSIRPTE